MAELSETPAMDLQPSLPELDRPALQLPRELWRQMRAEVAQADPEEACGLLAGKDGRGWRVIPVENQLHSRVRYRMEPQQLVAALIWIDEQELELEAIYHSHPAGPQTPSPTDIQEAFYPEAVYLIWSRSAEEWQCRGFIIQEARVREVPVRIEAE